MRLSDSLSLATRMFKTRPMRTFLTVLGVSIGIGAVLFLVSFGYGLQRVILSKITTADALLSLSITPGPSDLVALRDRDIQEILEMEEVVEVSPLVNLSAQFSVEGFTGDGFVMAVKPSFFRLSGLSANKGSLLSPDDKFELIVSSAGIKLFSLTEDNAIGREVSLSLFIPVIAEDGFEELEVSKRDDKYTIVGIINDESASYAYIPLGTIKDLNIKEYDHAQAKVGDSELMPGVRDKIIEKGFLVSSLSDTIEQANKIFKIIQIILALFGLVALAVSAIGMFNTMTIALLERINEIGIMRAIGMTKGDIKFLFLVESILMGFFGGVGGIVTGILGGKLANFGINLLAKTFGGQSLNLFYSPPWFLIFIIAFSTIIGFLTGVYPSLKASRLNPLNALRYK